MEFCAQFDRYEFAMSRTKPTNDESATSIRDLPRRVRVSVSSWPVSGYKRSSGPDDGRHGGGFKNAKRTGCGSRYARLSVGGLLPGRTIAFSRCLRDGQGP